MQLHPFFKSSPVEGEWSVSRSVRFTRKTPSPDPYLIGGWVGPGRSEEVKGV
jgi:hypothetical protein